MTLQRRALRVPHRARAEQAEDATPWRPDIPIPAHAAVQAACLDRTNRNDAIRCDSTGLNIAD